MPMMQSIALVKDGCDIFVTTIGRAKHFVEKKIVFFLFLFDFF